MIKNTLIAVAALSAFMIVPTIASAEDSAPKINYAAKKQGRVAFENVKEDQVSAVKEGVNEINPADIEPAAGGYEPQAVTPENTVAKSIKLPRKN